jgi:hypothetical protein
MTGVKKLRGGKRYYRDLHEQAATFGLDLDSGRTYDLWHKQFDWHGHSRRGVCHRAEHLAALFVAFKRTLVETSASSVPAQVFVGLAPACHSEQDALYVHTPNPNGTPFPHSFNGVRWDIATPAFLRRFVDGEAWEIGALSGKDEGWWVVRPRLGGEV